MLLAWKGELIMKDGDLFITVEGMKFEGDTKYKCGSLFEYDSSLESGAGRIYSMGGKPHPIWWRYPDLNMKVDGLPSEYISSFKHGVYDFYIEESIYNECKSPLEIILKSDFKVITEESQKESELAESCDTLDLIRDNLRVVVKHITSKHIELLFENIGVVLPPVKNGELGLWNMYVYNRYLQDQHHLITSLFSEDYRQLVIEAVDKQKENKDV
jgi:hypothetical protein